MHDDLTPSLGATAPTIRRATDGSIVVTLPATPVVVAAPDGLVHRGNSGIEARAFDALVASGELPSRKLGRRVYARRSDLLKLIDVVRAEPQAPVDELAAAVAKAARRRTA